jgi:RNA polymerase sigma-70 factor (ECF subfamily)
MVALYDISWEGDGGVDGEIELCKAAAGDNAEARRALVARLLRPVRNLARYLSKNDADADDIAQTAMVEILRSVGTFKGRGTLKSWALRITGRAAWAHIGKSRSESKIAQSVRDEDPGEKVLEFPAADSGFVFRRRLSECLDTLNPERRAVLVFKLVMGYSIKEIAELTGVSVNTVKDRLRVGRLELHDLLARDPVFRRYADEVRGDG